MNIVLTGVPRAGTTLACHLLNRVLDTVALHEPIDPEAVARAGDTGAMCDAISRFFTDTRRSRAGVRHGALSAASRSRTGQPRPRYRRPRRPTSAQGLDGRRPHRSPIERAVHPRGQAQRDVPPPSSCGCASGSPVSLWSGTRSRSWRPGAPSTCRFTMATRPRRSASTASWRPGSAIRAIGSIASSFSSPWFYTRFREALPDEHVLRYEDLVTSRGRSLAGTGRWRGAPV